MPVTRWRADAALIAVTVLWGTTFLVVKGALADISPLLFIALRFSVGFLALAAIYARAVRRKGLETKDWLPGLFAGCLLFGAFAFQTIGLGLTTPSKSAFLTSLSIPMVPLAGSIVYRNRPRLMEVAGIVIASFGMILMTLPRNLFTPGLTGFQMNKGDILTLLCAALFALHIVAIGHYAPAVGFESLAVIQIGVVAALAWVSCGFAEAVRFHPRPAPMTAVVLTGLLATALAFTTMAWAQQYTSSTRAALIFALEPVVAWLASWLLTGETIENRGKVGAGLILAGIVLVEVRFSELRPELKRVRSEGHH